MRFAYIIFLHISQICALSCIQNGALFNCSADEVCYRNTETTNCKTSQYCPAVIDRSCSDVTSGPCCCDRDNCNRIKRTPATSEDALLSSGSILAICIGVFLLVLVGIISLIVYRRKRRRNNLSISETQKSDEESPAVTTQSETRELLTQSTYKEKEESSSESKSDQEIIHYDKTNDIIHPLTSKEMKNEILDSLKNKKPPAIPGVDRLTNKARLEVIETYATTNTITLSEHFVNDRGGPILDDRSMCLHILNRLLRYGPRETPFEVKELKIVLKAATKVLRDEPSLVKIRVPAIIYGDIHGQYSDLLRWFNLNGWPHKTRSVFLGDFVDRGSHGIEVVALISCLKVLYPESIFLCRGNHEEENLNKAYSFFDEVRARFGDSSIDNNIYDSFKDLFNHLPLAALVGQRILGMHGGLSPHLKKLEDIEEINRPIDEFINGTLACDLVWSDPNLATYVNDEYKPNYEREPKSGIGQLFSVEAVKHACDSLGVDMIIRGHQVPLHGYGRWANGRLFTLFSAPGYKGLKTPTINLGACIQVPVDGKLVIKRIKVTEEYRRNRIQDTELKKKEFLGKIRSQNIKI